MWNAAQRILNSRKYGHEGTYLPMRIIDSGTLAGYISMNRAWAGFDYEDYYRASQIAMGILDSEPDVDLEKEYLPEGGRRLDCLVDDHGISQIARDLTAAEQKIKDEMEGRDSEDIDAGQNDELTRSFQVVSGEMFSRVHEPVIRITPKNITFNKSCVAKLPGVESVELLLNPIERMMVIRPCAPEHPNAMTWDARSRGAAPLSKVIYSVMGWEEDYSFRIPCQTVSDGTPGHTVLVFDLDNYVGRSVSKKDEAIIAVKEAEQNTEEREDAASYYYPPDDDEPQEIRDMEERFMQAVEVGRKTFGEPAFRHESGMRSIPTDSEWDMMTEARPLDVTHTVNADDVDDLLLAIMNDPPALPHIECTSETDNP